MAITFEMLLERFEKLPRMFIEPDGSLVWRGTTVADSVATAIQWQLDGMIYDHLGAVRYVELKGNCSTTAWQQLLQILDYPTQPLTVHHVNQGRYESLEEFSRQYILS